MCIPIISQWPVTESFPRDKGKRRPNSTWKPGRPLVEPTPQAVKKPALMRVGALIPLTISQVLRMVEGESKSPNSAASGVAPAPQPSITMTIALFNSFLLDSS